MLLAETIVFIISLITIGALLFLLIYFIITLSDLECDYLNVNECCVILNYWMLPKFIGQTFLTFFLFLHGQFYLFILNLPMFIWISFQYFTVPSGNLGAYDPAEILNRGQLKKHMRDVLIKVGHYLVFFFIYLYCFIVSLLKSDPLSRESAEEIVTEL